MDRKADKPLTHGDYRVLAEFRAQLRQFLLFSENAARKAGLQPRHHQALLAIKGFADATVGDLAARLGIRPHSAAELVNRLVAARLVRRVTDTMDRRRVHLRQFEAWAKANRDIEVINVTQGSHLTCFPMARIEDVADLQRA